MKDCSSVVIPSSIPSSATWEPDVDLSPNEGFEEVLNDFDDEPVMRTRVSDSNEDNGGGEHEIEADRKSVV